MLSALSSFQVPGTVLLPVQKTKIHIPSPPAWKYLSVAVIAVAHPIRKDVGVPVDVWILWDEDAESGNRCASSGPFPFPSVKWRDLAPFHHIPAKPRSSQRSFRDTIVQNWGGDQGRDMRAVHRICLDIYPTQTSTTPHMWSSCFSGPKDLSYHQEKSAIFIYMYKPALL